MLYEYGLHAKVIKELPFVGMNKILQIKYFGEYTLSSKFMRFSIYTVKSIILGSIRIEVSALLCKGVSRYIKHYFFLSY